MYGPVGPIDSAARGNIEAALAKLRDASPVGPPVPSQYLWNTETILKVCFVRVDVASRLKLTVGGPQGNMDAAWGLLHHLAHAFPNTKPTTFPSRRHGGSMRDSSTRAGSASVPRLPYSTADMWRLERSVLSWLYSLGVLRDYCTWATRLVGGGLLSRSDRPAHSCCCASSRWCPAKLAAH